jgi:DNA polymerase-1
MIAHFLLDERQGTHSLERLAIKYYNAPPYKSEFRLNIGATKRGYISDAVFESYIVNAPKKDLFDYNGADVDYTYRLARDLTHLVEKDGQLPVLRDIEMPACRTFSEFYMHGLLVDRTELERLGSEWGGIQDGMVAKMREMVGDPDFKPSSTKQLAHYLYDVLHLSIFGGNEESAGKLKIDEDTISKFIQTVDDPEAVEYWTSKRIATSESAAGAMKGISPRTTGAYMLYWLRQQHEFPNLVLQWRHAKKRMSMYYTAWKQNLYSDNRIRPRYNICAARTGRKATTDPAIHNLPRGDEVYNLIIPDPGWCQIHTDYAQAEMRIMAHYSHDEELMHVLETSDIHTTVAMEMFHLTQEDVDKMSKDELADKRIAAKMLSFGIPYGRSPVGLAPQLRISKEEAAAYIRSFFNRFPDLEKWLLYQRNKGIEDQVIVSVFGRKRRFPLIVDRFHKKEIERQAGNFAIQSAINDLTLMAYAKTMDDLTAAGIPRHPGAHIHDSFSVFVPIPFWVESVRVVAKAMNRIPFETDVKFPAEIEVGDRWGHLITVVSKKGKWARLDPEDATIPAYITRVMPDESEPVQ